MIHKLKETKNGYYIGQCSDKEVERLFVDTNCRHVICNTVTYNYLKSHGLLNSVIRSNDKSITWTSYSKIMDFCLFINTHC